MIIVLTTLCLFVWFLIAMYFLRRRHELRTRAGLAYWLLVATVVPGIAFDIAYNWTFGIIIFRDITPDLTLSKRMERYREALKYKATWRMRWADWICEHLLNPYDPKGRHC